MKKEKQIGVRVGLPAFFALEVEDVYKHASGAHRALAFPDFPGFLIGLGLEEYRKGNTPEGGQKEPDEDESRPAVDPLNLSGIKPAGLPDLFREFDGAMELPEEETPGFRLVRAGKVSS
jgi:hypothetical protein